MHRRHLTESQRAMIAAGVAKREVGDNQHTTGEGSGIPLPSQARAAADLNVSVDSVKAAKTVQSKGTPDLQQAVIDGDVTVSAAAEVTTLLADE